MNWRRWLRFVGYCAVLVLIVVGTLALTLNVWHSGDFDVLEYQQYAQSFWWGQPRFQALPREYPPLSLLLFSVTLFAGHGDPRTIFGACIGVLFLLGYLAFSRFSGRGRALWFAGYLLVGTQGILLARYDLAPALLTLGALWATQRHRFGWAYLLLIIGVLLKLYPIVLVPVVLTEHVWALSLDMPRTLGANRRLPLSQVLHRLVWPAAYKLLPGVALLAAGIALPLLRSHDALTTLTYMYSRPIQVESFQATLLWLRMVFGVPLHVTNTFGSDNWVGDGAFASALAMLSTLVLVSGCLVVYWRLARRRISVGRAFLLCICIVLVTSKVFSTQYLIWVLPLVAEVEGASLVWILICLLTFLDYPLLYPFNQPGYTLLWEHGFMLVVALRNTLVVYVILRGIAGRRIGAVHGRLASKVRTIAEAPQDHSLLSQMLRSAGLGQ